MGSHRPKEAFGHAARSFVVLEVAAAAVLLTVAASSIARPSGHVWVSFALLSLAAGTSAAFARKISKGVSLSPLVVFMVAATLLLPAFLTVLLIPSFAVVDLVLRPGRSWILANNLANHAISILSAFYAAHGVSALLPANVSMAAAGAVSALVLVALNNSMNAVFQAARNRIRLKAARIDRESLEGDLLGGALGVVCAAAMHSAPWATPFVLTSLIALPRAYSLPLLRRDAEERTRELQEQRKHATERQRLLARTVEAAEAERMALAADLHDGPIQHLTAAAFTLDLLARKVDHAALDEARVLVQKLSCDVRNEITSLRQHMTGLRPPIIEERGIEAAIDDCTHAVLDGEVSVSFESHLNGTMLAPELETVLYRVAREALVNVHRHADARDVHVTLEASDPGVALTITDDGVGCPFEGIDEQAVDQGHYGLITMRERVESVGGAFELTSDAGSGTTILVTLPLRQREQALCLQRPGVSDLL